MNLEQEILSQTNAAFRFVVEIGSQKMAAFTECSLPQIDWEDRKSTRLNSSH